MAKKGVGPVAPSSSSSSSTPSGAIGSPTKTTTTKSASMIQKPPFLLHKEPSASSSSSSSSLSTSQTPSSSSPTFSESFDGVAKLLHGRKNIVVLVGAGMSVSCGIPDFRSKGSGLYSTLDIEGLGLSCPEELFDWEFFQEDPGPFFKFARNLYFPLGQQKKIEPSDSHKLLAVLEQKKMLLRVYSQNIDGLETIAGVSPKKMVYAHGSLQWATCCKCQRKVSSEEILPSIEQGTIPRCQVERKKGSSSGGSGSGSSGSSSTTTTRTSNKTSTAPLPLPSSSSSTAVSSSPSRASIQRIGKKRPRSQSSDSSSNNNNNNNNSTSTTTSSGDGATRNSNRVCGGVYKPAVTFFGETLNDNVRRALEADKKKVDALIVIGTSLSVAPISKVIEYLPANIPRILINRTIVHPSTNSSGSTEDDDEDDIDENERDFRTNYVFDAYLLGFCDDVTRALGKELFKRRNSGNGSKSKSGKNLQINKNNTTSTTASSKRGVTDTTSSSSSSSSSTPDCGGTLLASVLQNGNDDYYDVEDWSEIVVPPERVLLFPGALPSTKEDKNASMSELTYREIAHCDGCSKRISGTVQKCVMCFDYDLCPKCFPGLSQTHYEGKHTFNAEPAS